VLSVTRCHGNFFGIRVVCVAYILLLLLLNRCVVVVCVQCDMRFLNGCFESSMHLC
jgi:hypothetical protein